MNEKELKVMETLKEMQELACLVCDDAKKLQEKYVKARAKKMRARLDKIANLKIQLRKIMLDYERN